MACRRVESTDAILSACVSENISRGRWHVAGFPGPYDIGEWPPRFSRGPCQSRSR
jgi:hypothetical protein